MLLENLAAQEPVFEVAEPHRRRVAGAVRRSSDSDLRVSASVGVAFATREDGVEELMRNADVAMYSAKAAGQGPLCGLRGRNAGGREPAPGGRGGARAGTDPRTSSSCITSRSSNCDSGYLLGVEALVRWRHPKRGMMAPARVPGRRGGLGADRRHWVAGCCGQACAEVKAWQARLPEGRQVRARRSMFPPASLRDSDLVADVSRALEETRTRSGLPRHRSDRKRPDAQHRETCWRS